MLNLGALKTLQEDLNKKGGEGGGIFFYANKLKEETDIRILPPLSQQKGIYFLELIKWWIKGKSYTSPATFNFECPIEAEIAQAEDLKDKDIKALLDNKNNKTGIKRAFEYWIPVLVLTKCEFDNSGTLTKYEVLDNEPKIFVCGPTMIKAINRVVTARAHQNGTEDGIADRVKGSTIVVNKTGVELNTEYSAISGSPGEIDEKWFALDKVPDIVGMAEKILNKGGYDDYLAGVIRNYLYGEPMPEAPKDEEDGKAERSAPAPVSKFTPPPRAKAETAKPAATDAGKGSETPAPAARGSRRGQGSENTNPPPPARRVRSTEQKDGERKPTPRSAMNDLENLD